jgi:predicted Zn-dependent protease
MPRLRSLVAILALSVAGGSMALLGASSATAASSGTAPATTSDAKASEAARQRHQQVLQQFGRYDDERLQQYVNEVGQRVAANSDRPDLTYTFTVLDNEQLNAFADPGGYIYVFRGLLPYLSSEAELAATLGHEIGHVTARHSAHRQAGATAANVGATLIGILTGSPDLMNVAGMAGGVLVSGYSREQESEADELGVKFISRAGYEPTAMAESLQKFWSQEQFELQKAREEDRNPSGHGGMLASHPETDKRIRELRELVSKTASSTGEQRPANRDVYLANIDGLAFGTSAAQGVVRGSRFYHGGMGVTLAFPSGWTVDNQPSKLIAQGPASDKMIEVTAQPIPPNMAPKEFLGSLLRGQASTAAEPLEFNGLSGYRANLRSTGLPWGGKGPASVAVVYNNGLAYIFLGATRVATEFGAFEPIFVSSIKTFRRLRDNEFAAAEPERIRVMQAGPDTRIEELARKSPNTRYPAEELRLLNDLYPDKEPAPGQKLKIVD